MLRLIRAELYKLFKTRTFKVLLIVSILMALLSISLSKLTSSEEFIKSTLKGTSSEYQEQYMKELKTQSSENLSKIVQPGSLGMHASFKDIFHPTAKEIFNSSFGSGIIEILLAVLIGTVAAREYSSGTIKNVLAYGKKREYFYISKIVASTTALIIFLGIIVFLTTAGSAAIFGWGEPFGFSQVLYILKFFAAAVIVGASVVSLLVLLATVLKSNGATIAMGVTLFVIIPTVIAFLYGKFDWFDKIYEMTPAYTWSLATFSGSSDSDLFRASMTGLITVIIASVVGITIFKRQDIK